MACFLDGCNFKRGELCEAWNRRRMSKVLVCGKITQSSSAAVFFVPDLVQAEPFRKTNMHCNVTLSLIILKF